MNCISCGINPAPESRATKLCIVCTEHATRVFKPAVKYIATVHSDLTIRYSFYLDIGYVFIRVAGQTDRTDEVLASIFEYFGITPHVVRHFPDHTLKISPRLLAPESRHSYYFGGNTSEFSALIRVEFRVKNMRSLVYLAARQYAHFGSIDGVIEDVVDAILEHNSLLAVRYLYIT